MKEELLNLTPTRFLCPYCGDWHKWYEDSLGDFDSREYKATFECPTSPFVCNNGLYIFYFEDGYLNYSTKKMCQRANLAMNGRIPISSIVEDPVKPIVTFDVEFTSDNDVGMYECFECAFKNDCNCVRLGDKGDNRNMTITFGFEFEQSDYNKCTKSSQFVQLQERENAVKLKEQSVQERENALKLKEQSVQERENALKLKEQSVQESSLGNKETKQQQQIKKSAQLTIKEDATMANNIFNMNVEFGPNKDENIASTLLGIAVKNGDSWRIYDKKKKEITDMGEIKLGNMPIFILPTIDLKEGDLIKDAGEYYFVVKVEKGSTQTLCAKNGEMKNIVPIKNILGFNLYSKVIALSDSIDMGDDLDVEKLAIMSAMCGTNGENDSQSNQLLPLMLLKDKLNDYNDMMKIMLMSSMMCTPAEGGNQNATMNQFLPLILLKDREKGDDDMMKLVLMSSMMGGNMANNNNPVMGYLMLNMLTDKKKDNQNTQKTDENNQNISDLEKWIN